MRPALAGELAGRSLDVMLSVYYPVFLDLAGRLVTVVGSGAEVERKAAELLEYGARLRLVAPRGGEINGLPKGAFEVLPRSYRRGDLAGSFLAVCEPTVPEVEAVWRDAQELDIPLNVIDDPARCSFIAPAVARRGHLLVAISTSGRAPALAVRLRQELGARLGPEYERFLEIAGALRRPFAERVPELSQRRRLWYQLVDSDVLELLATGDEPGAMLRVREITGVTLEAAP